MLGPEPSGPGADMTKQPSSACLTSTTRGDLETTQRIVSSPSTTTGEADHQALTGLANQYPWRH